MIALLMSSCGQVVREAKPTCFDGELRLSETSCGSNAFLVEQCASNEWSMTEECRQPELPCLEGEVVESEEHCGEYDFNRVLYGCRGGVQQAVGCTCGTAEPSLRPPYKDQGSGGFEPDENGHIRDIEGVTFPEYLGFGPDPEVITTDLSHVRCAVYLISFGAVPILSGLLAVDQVHFDLDPSDEARRLEWGSVRKINYLTMRDVPNIDLRGLSSLEELNFLQIGSLYETGMTSLDGLERIEEMRSLGIGSSPYLRSLEGLKNLKSVEFNFSIGTTALDDLKGLENLRSVGEDLRLPIQSEKDLQILSKLENVGGDLRLEVTPDELICALPTLLDHVEVGGIVEVNGKELDLSECE